MAEPSAEELVHGHLLAALRLARMLVGNAAIAEDIAAESVARLLAARGRARIENADAYLRRIVVNQVIGRRRRFATERKPRRALSRPTAPPIPATRSSGACRSAAR